MKVIKLCEYRPSDCIHNIHFHHELCMGPLSLSIGFEQAFTALGLCNTNLLASFISHEENEAL
jgi:hypothetical protein